MLALLSVAALSVGLLPGASAAPVPDIGFGPDGLVTSSATAAYRDALAMADGSVVAVGGADDRLASTDAAGLLVRYDTTGTLEPTFGTAGTVSFLRPGFRIAFSHVEHGPKGTLVAFGQYARVGGECGVAVARVLAATGAPDLAFGSGGLVLRGIGSHLVCDVTGDSGQAQQFGGGTVLPDGRVVVTAAYGPGTDGHPSDGMRPAVLEMAPDGRPEPSFGGGTGRVVLATSVQRVGAPAATADGRLLVGIAVRSSHPVRATSGLVPVDAVGAVRLLPSGALDASFGRNGTTLRRPFGFFAGPGTVSVVVSPRGGVLVAGSLDVVGETDGYSDDALVAAFTSTGAVDATFGAGTGVARIRAMWVNRLVRGLDGSLIVVGAENNGPFSAVGPPPMYGRVAHLSANGTPDTTWGVGGVRTLRDPGTQQSSQAGVAVGADGTLTFAGRRQVNHLDPYSVEPAVFEATLTRWVVGPAVRHAVTVVALPTYAGGIARACGRTEATACSVRTTWYLGGAAWPIESHEPSRAVVTVQRRGYDRLWHTVAVVTVFVTDGGTYRAAGRLVSVGTYRLRAAVPASAATSWRATAWVYLHR